jgi:hypothetical protein
VPLPGGRSASGGMVLLGVLLVLLVVGSGLGLLIFRALVR